MRETLPMEVREFLREHGPSTASTVALGVRARRDDVDAVVAGSGFERVPRPEGASPRAVYFTVSLPVQGGRGGKSRAALMLAVLLDGRRHSRDEIFEKTGRFFLTNNAASELRRQGHDVRAGHLGRDVYVYWLVSPLAKPEILLEAAVRSASVSGSASVPAEAAA